MIFVLINPLKKVKLFCGENDEFHGGWCSGEADNVPRKAQKFELSPEW